MINAGITGQAGFMGSHLYNYLGTKPEEINRIFFKKSFFENEIELENFVKKL